MKRKDEEGQAKETRNQPVGKKKTRRVCIMEFKWRNCFKEERVVSHVKCSDQTSKNRSELRFSNLSTRKVVGMWVGRESDWDKFKR